MEKKEYTAVGEITIEPIPFLEINELQIERQINDHARFSVKGKIDEKDRMLLPDLCSFGNEAIVKKTKEDRILFRGLITELLIEQTGDVFGITVRAVSHTILLDGKKRNRPFHDIGKTIEELIRKVTSETAGAKTIVEDACAVPVGQFIMQYEETDWEFMKRVASHCGRCLFPDSNYGYPAFYTGKPGPDTGVEMEEAFPYMIYNGELADGSRQSGSECMTYIVKANHLWLRLGECVRFRGRKFYIKSIRTVLEQSILKNEYELCTYEGVHTNTRYNPIVAGRLVTGIVQGIERDMVNVRVLTADGNGGGEACWFPYSTVYASPEGGGWYCMPEIGDKVRVQFPDENEGNAYAVSAVSEYRPKRGEGDRMGDYTRRYIRNRQGMEVLWTPERVTITANGGSLIDVNQNGMVSVSANANVRIHAGKDVVIEAGNQINISGGSGIQIECGAKAEIVMDETGIIELKGNEVYTN